MWLFAPEWLRSANKAREALSPMLDKDNKTKSKAREVLSPQCLTEIICQNNLHVCLDDFSKFAICKKLNDKIVPSGKEGSKAKALSVVFYF